MATLKDESPGHNDWATAWDSLTSAIGAAQGLNSGTIDDVDHMTVDQRLKVAEVAALLSISQEVNHLRHAISTDGGEDRPNHIYY